MRRAALALPTVLLAASAALPLSCARPRPAPPPPSPEAPPPPAAQLPCPRIERLRVDKSVRSLTAECTGGGRRVYPIALAREPGPKQAAGDQRMPEGEYHVAGPPRRSRFHLFIPIDYPSPADADRALADGLITKEQHAAIADAHRRGRLPPQDTALGGNLGVHGEGERWRGDLDLNWTYGCIAVSDQAIEELARLVARGTRITIEP